MRISEKEAMEVYDILEETFPDAKAELHYNTPYELLVATILSAQCTDVRVNKVTEVLFQEYNTPEKMTTLSQEELEDKIHSCGVYRNKAKNILASSRILLDKYDGEVPETIKELMTLPGVGRKTANVVASNAFGVPAIAVDTHVFRVSNRIGLADSKNVEGTERQLMEIWPESRWSKGHHLLIFLGRRICKAQRPLCEACSLTEHCLYYKGMEKTHE
ncbi:MAG: endonuclease III [Peptoniphilus sp.]|nr:endonuclease III [Peptoniphilus sp.]MDD7363611.1 endonuclease III [Bacillota bacterium]MDY6045198.1 endonuclease III [Peptoniphilus sp.]